eukprot:scaffold5899_cov167-Amphora_coffeaeformis.AAC.6
MSRVDCEFIENILNGRISGSVSQPWSFFLAFAGDDDNNTFVKSPTSPLSLGRSEDLLVDRRRNGAIVKAVIFVMCDRTDSDENVTSMCASGQRV